MKYVRKTRRFLSKVHKSRKKQRAGVRSNISMNEKKNLRAVLLYERTPKKTKIPSGNNMTIKERITNLLARQNPINESVIVYRGQSNYKIHPDQGWFSTSLRKDVAISYASKHVFKIHIQPGVRILDMYKYYNEYGIFDPVKEFNELQKNYFKDNYFTNNDYTKFQEILVEGNGTFWQDSEKTVEGFKLVGKVKPVSTMLEEINVNDPELMLDIYETYYFPPRP